MAEQTLNKEIFDLTVENHDLLHRAYVAYLANGRSAAAKTKKRGEVRGGGRKPWRQKGTGRARIGSIRAPHWRGGGVTFGPTGDQNYTKKLPKKMKNLAVRQALSLKAQAGEVKVCADIKLSAAKTKEAVKFLEGNKAEGRVLVVVAEKDLSLVRAMANLPTVQLVRAMYLNVYDILNADLILIEKAATSDIENRLILKEAIA